MGSNGHDVAGTDISSDWTSCSVTASKCDRTCCGDEAVDCRIVAILSRKKLANTVYERCVFREHNHGDSAHGSTTTEIFQIK